MNISILNNKTVMGRIFVACLPQFCNIRYSCLSGAFLSALSLDWKFELFDSAVLKDRTVCDRNVSQNAKCPHLLCTLQYFMYTVLRTVRRRKSQYMYILYNTLLYTLYCTYNICYCTIQYSRSVQRLITAVYYTMQNTSTSSRISFKPLQ